MQDLSSFPRHYTNSFKIEKMKAFIAAFLLLVISFDLSAQSKDGKNYVQILPGDTEEDIIRKASQVVPSARQLKWQQMELTAFFHFGINTFTGREWGDGKEDPALFDPSGFDARQWVRETKAAGFKLVILTAKHHDGFCLWPTETTNYSVKNSPWKNRSGDVVKEVAEACKEYGISFGVYLSPWDRNAQVYGTEAYNDLFVAQLTELLSNYGRVDEVWFDGANGEGPNGKKQVYDFGRYYKLIRKLQPQAVIAVMGPDVRWVGTETGYGREQEWSVVPVNTLSQEAIAGNSQNDLAFKPQGDMMGSDLGSREKIRDAKGLVWYPAETDVSIRPGWFYHKEEDDKVKTPEKLLDIYFNSVGRNGVLLLNIPPDKRGLIHENDVKVLREWKRLRDEIFSNNLAKKALISSDNGIHHKALTDGKFETSFTTKKNYNTTTLTIRMKEAATFDVLLLQENIAAGQRIEKFALDLYEGGEWKQIAEGTTIGYKRLLKFTPVRASLLRLRILSSRSNPMISELGLYKLP
jgi:alpha-L-fucosidase